jgi:hypothetical protein
MVFPKTSSCCYLLLPNRVLYVASPTDLCAKKGRAEPCASFGNTPALFLGSSTCSTSSDTKVEEHTNLFGVYFPPHIRWLLDPSSGIEECFATMRPAFRFNGLLSKAEVRGSLGVAPRLSVGLRIGGVLQRQGREQRRRLLTGSYSKGPDSVCASASFHLPVHSNCTKNQADHLLTSHYSFLIQSRNILQK